MSVTVVVLDHEVPGLDAAATAGHPDRQFLLHRARPDIHIAKLVVLAVERERLRLAPRAQDEPARLLETLPHLDRRLSIRKDRIHRGAEHKPGRQPSTRQAVQICILFGDPGRRIVERQRIADDHDGGVPRGRGEARGEQIGRRRHRERRLMMFVDGETVEADLVSELHQPDEHFVGFAGLERIAKVRGRCHPCRVVVLAKISRKMRVRNFCKPVKFHPVRPPPSILFEISSWRVTPEHRKTCVSRDRSTNLGATEMIFAISAVSYRYMIQR